MNKKIIISLLIAFIIKTAFFIFFALQFLQYYPSADIVSDIFIIGGDTYSYFPPIEAFVDGKGYSYLHEAKGEIIYKPTSERMPGLLPIYAPLYYFFGETTAKFLFILVQFSISTIALFLLAYIAKEFFNSWLVFYFTLGLYSFSTFITVLDHWGQSDSLSISFSIIGIYFFIKAIKTSFSNDLTSHTTNYFLYLLAGIFICWATFIRPVYGIFFVWLILVYTYLFLPKIRLQFKSIFYHLFLFSLPLAISLSIWTARNYLTFDKFIPLQTAYTDMFAEHTWLFMMKLIPMTGGDFQPWSQGSIGQWFYPSFLENKYYYPKDPIKQSPFSKKHFTPDFNLDSLIVLRERYQNSFRYELSEKERKNYQQLTIKSANFYISSYKKHHPFRYYFLSPLEISLKFLFVTNLGRFPFPKFSEMKFYQKIVKGASILFYNLIVLLGIIGFFLAFRKRKRLAILICSGVLPYIGLITLYYKVIEHRYFATAYPFFVIFAAYTCMYLTQLMKDRQMKNVIST